MFFLIDPLDGTKEFVNRNTDFTVNIALVRDGVPEIGVVYAPCTGRFFSGRPGNAELIDLDAKGDIVAPPPDRACAQGATPLTIVASRSHRTPETDDFIGKVEAAEIVSVGSSLKFCLRGQRRGRHLSALRPHHGMGHGGGRRGAARRRRLDLDARRQAARLRQVQPVGRCGLRQPATSSPAATSPATSRGERLPG